MSGKERSAPGRRLLVSGATALGRRRHRAFALSGLAVLGLLMSVLSPASAQPSKPSVHVFLQTDAKSSALEKALQIQAPGLNITVFSRYRDLEDASAEKPDAVVAIPPVLQQRGKKPTLQGTRHGKDCEPYLLVSVGHVLDGPLSGKVIGAVDVLGRDGTQVLVANLLKTDDLKVKRVTKSEDLLPLLEFSAADGILIPGSALVRLSERTQLAIKSKEVPGSQVGLPALAIFNEAHKEAITKVFLEMNAATKKLLGVDAWSVR